MTKNKTISYILRNDLCTGCGTCVSLCPNDAIEMKINEKKGIYIPKLNEDKCNLCGICYKVCPGRFINLEKMNLWIHGKEREDGLIGNYLSCYVGHSTNCIIRYNSASGGLITALLTLALEEGIIDGALVTRMKKDNPLVPEPFIARTKEEIMEASKSKYCPVPANIALKEILESKEDEKFAVVGLPCHIHGIRKAEKLSENLRKKIVLHLGLFCNHTPTFLATEFLLRKMKVKKEEINELSYRGKGWPGGMVIKLKNGNEIFIPHFSNYYWGLVFNSFFWPIRCTICNDKTSKLADISFGDAWLSEFMNDMIGTSIIVSRNKIGEEILQNAVAKRKIKLSKISFDKVLRSQSLYFVEKRLKTRISFLKLLGKNVPTYFQETLKSRFLDYLHVMRFYLLNHILSNRYFWNLTDLYILLKRCQERYKLFFL